MQSVVDASGATFNLVRSARMPIFIQPAQQRMPPAPTAQERMLLGSFRATGEAARCNPQALPAPLHRPVDTGALLRPPVRVPAPPVALQAEVPKRAPMARRQVGASDALHPIDERAGY